jgi:hypothetical protein
LSNDWRKTIFAAIVPFVSAFVAALRGSNFVYKIYYISYTRWFILKQVVIVANFAATFGGNFIQSMKALQANEEISVRYILPEVARKCNWIGSVK